MPHEILIKRSRKDKNPLKLTYDFGADIHDAISKFNGGTVLENVVFDLYLHAAKQKLIAYASGLLEETNEYTKKPYTPAEIQALVAKWKPITNVRSHAAVKKIAEAFEDLTPAEREALKAKLDKIGATEAAEEKPTPAPSNGDAKAHADKGASTAGHHTTAPAGK